jgi:tRNA(Ile)-lysidine synthase
LLEGWCAERRCLHLLTAHHLEDRAETFWLRLARGSGVDGLAGISAVAERAQCRVLRPLLDVPPERLRARLRREGQAWIEDPSNRNTEFGRVRIRQARALLAAEGLSAERLAETLRHLGRARQAPRDRNLRALARRQPACRGLRLIEAEAIRRAEPELGLRARGRARDRRRHAVPPSRLERLERLYEALGRDELERGRTLGRCRLVPMGPRLLVCREAAAVEGPVALSAGGTCVWDGRFRIETASPCPDGMTVGALGRDGRELPPEAMGRLRTLPGPARLSLVALRDRTGLAEVPALGWSRGAAHSLGIAQITFRPSRGIAPVGFTVV